MKKVREHHTKNAEIGVITINILDSDGEVAQRRAISIFQPNSDGNGYKSLIRYLKPKLAYGTTLLTEEKPDGTIEQTLCRARVGSFSNVTHDKLRSHIGKSPFEFEDLTQENPDRYQYSRLLNETIDGIPCYKIMASPPSMRKTRNACTKKHVFSILLVRTSTLLRFNTLTTKETLPGFLKDTTFQRKIQLLTPTGV